MKRDFDVGIIGGGPAGAATAGYLAKGGLRVGVFEGDLFPRPHVGESFVPATTRVFRELGFLETMEAAGFPKKYGAAWTVAQKAPVYETQWKGLEGGPPAATVMRHEWKDLGPDEWNALIEFQERAQPEVDQPYTYHVDRGKFDTLLLQHAAGLGADVHEGVRVQSVDFVDGGSRLNFAMGRADMHVDCGMVVDASGRRTLLGNQLKLKVKDPVFDQYAIHTWFDGFDRKALATHAHQVDFIFVHFLPVTNTWVWQIPITDTITSIGVVTQKKSFAARREDREAFFWECLRSRPELHDAVRASKQVRPFKDEGDYSYAMKEITGDRFVLVGDAARFVDPIFSTGVSIAMTCGRFVSRDILRAAETGDFSKNAFSTYATTLRRGTKNWYDFISVYYRLNVLFTRFINDKRYRLDVLKLLQGDVYDEEQPEVLGIMKRIVGEVESDPKHLWHGALGSLTADTFKPLF
jgi:FADH2 O2-dependent halogenase